LTCYRIAFVVMFASFLHGNYHIGAKGDTMW
jgi:hypothetical protein